MKVLFIVTLALSTISNPLFAFPEMIRHGYANCITCHQSPNGGGITTLYGRALSQEALSTWAKEGESDFLWGLIKTPESLNLGGDVRLVQTHLDTPTLKEGRFIVMQADLEAGVTYKQIGAVATLGKRDVSMPGNFVENFTSRRHFITYHPTEELYFRAGRFQKAFGINLPDHIVSTKRELGWDYGTETHNIEAAWIGEKFDVFVTGVFGRLDKPELKREEGFALRTGYNFGDTYKTGLSYFYGSNDRSKRHVYGPYGMLGLRKNLFILGEFDFQNQKTNSGNDTFGIYQYLRIDYEILQGLHLYFAEDYAKPNFKDAASVSNSFGPGIQFFPRPHFEWVASYQKRRRLAVHSDYSDFYWLQFHYYL